MKKDIRYVPSNPEVVEQMLEMAWVGAGDEVYDLGSGDGRLVMAAALRGALATGVDIDLRLVERSRASAAAAHLSETARFRHENFHDTDLRRATVVMLYLFQKVNLALLPKLRRELRPGARIISQAFDMGSWEPSRIVDFEGRLLFLWVMP